MMSDKLNQGAAASIFSTTPTAPKGQIAAVNVVQSSMDSIKQIIIREGLGPGDPLPSEVNLCDYLGVSRSSVREALRRLEALDIVRAQHGKGVFVSDMSLRPMVETLVLRGSVRNGNQSDLLRQVVQMRKYLDLGLAEAVVASYAEGRSTEELHFIVDDMIAKAKKGESFQSADVAFHAGILEGLNNDVVVQFTSAIWLVHNTIVPPLLSSQEDAQLLRTARAHRDMLASVEAGDVQAYREAVIAHYAPLECLIEMAEE